MKNTTLTLLAILSTIATASAALPPLIPQPTTITYTLLVQNESPNNNGVSTTTPAAGKVNFDTKQLLALMAIDEFNERNYGSSTFPAGAQLVFMDYYGDLHNSYWVVEDKNGNLLVNVSDLLTFQAAGENTVESGTQNNTTGQLSSVVQTHLDISTFDDTGAGGTLKFDIQGEVTSKVSDKVVNATDHTYTRSIKASGSSLTGEGTSDGVPFIITGTASSSGEATISPF